MIVVWNDSECVVIVTMLQLIDTQDEMRKRKKGKWAQTLLIYDTVNIDCGQMLTTTLWLSHNEWVISLSIHGSARPSTMTPSTEANDISCKSRLAKRISKPRRCAQHMSLSTRTNDLHARRNYNLRAIKQAGNHGTLKSIGKRATRASKVILVSGTAHGGTREPPYHLEYRIVNPYS